VKGGEERGAGWGGGGGPPSFKKTEKGMAPFCRNLGEV